MRNGMTAAAAAGGALAVTVPAVTVATAPATEFDTAVVRSASEVAASEVAGAAPAGGVRMLASVVPVASRDEPEPPQIDVEDLLKAAGLVDVVRAAEERRARAECDADLDGLGRVKPGVRAAARFLSCLYDEPDLIGVAGRGRQSDHPSGLALDLMVRGERGDRIAECALANQDELGITYVIWKQRVNYGDGWERMADRGSDTENHYDHVHISFARGGGDGDPSVDSCR